MTGIVFFYEDNKIDMLSGIPDMLDPWNYAIKQIAGDFTDVIIVNKTNQRITFNQEFNVQVVDDLPELAGHVTQIVCPWSDVNPKTELWDFNHETDWYVFGPANGWLDEKIGDTFLTVPQSDNVNACHSVNIAYIILAHRFHKIGA